MAKFRTLHQHLEGLNNFISYQQNNDSQYTLFIPWCGQTLEWQLLLNDSFPKRPPDFIFDDQFFSPFLPWEKDTSIRDLMKSWDTKDLQSLKILILGLLEAYKNYQIEIVKNLQHQQVQFELESLDYTSYEVQVERSNLPGDFSQIRILVKLRELDEKFEQNLSRIQQQDLLGLNNNFQNLQMSSQSALVVIFGVQQNNKNSTNRKQISSFPDIRIKLSDLILSQIGQIDQPEWTEDQCIVGYIDLINKEIEKGLKKFAQTRDIRSEYVDLLGQNIGFQTEFFDPSSGFSSANFFVNFDEFQFAVTVIMEERFPTQPPQLIFESLQRNNLKKVVYIKKWNMNWSTQDMADYTFDFVKDSLTEIVNNMR